MKKQLESLKKEVAELQMENEAHQVENCSLERLLQQGADVYTTLKEEPVQTTGAVIWGPSILGDRLLERQEELMSLQRTRTELERKILQSNDGLKDQEAAHERDARKLL